VFRSPTPERATDATRERFGRPMPIFRANSQNMRMPDDFSGGLFYDESSAWVADSDKFQERWVPAAWRHNRHFLALVITASIYYKKFYQEAPKPNIMIFFDPQVFVSAA
jgi:hypothetical protein